MMAAANLIVVDDRVRLVEAILPHLERLGWREARIVRGAGSACRPEWQLWDLFPNAHRFASAIEQWADVAMMERAAQMDLSAMRVPEKMTTVLMARLEVTEPFEKAVLAFRNRLGPIARLVAAYRTADATWRAIGDSSVGFNAFTKRSTLAAAFVSVPDFWLRSNGDRGATQAYLQSRLAAATRLFAPVRRMQALVLRAPRQTR